MVRTTKDSDIGEGLKTVTKGAGLVFFGLVFSKVLTYFYRLIIARYYGPEDYGMISIGLSLSGILVVLLILGLDSAMVRYVSEYRVKNDNKRIKGVLIVPFAISIPLSILAAIILWFYSPSIAGLFAKDILTKTALTIVFQAFSFTIPFTVCYNIIQSTFIGFKKVKFNVYTDNVFYSVTLLLTVIAFSFFNMGFEGILLSYIFTVVTSFLLIFYWFRKHIFRKLKGIGTIFETRKMIYYSFPLFIGSVASVGIGSFDTIFLGALKTAADAGIYNAALPTAKFVIIFSSAFGALFSPIIIEYKTKKMRTELQSFYKTVTKWIFITGFPFALLLIFFSRNVLNLLFGPEYISAAPSLSILGFGFFIYSMFMTSYAMLMAKDKTKYAMAIFIISALANAVLNILLIPSYGIFGAAISTAFSAIFILIADAFFAWKFTKMNPFDAKAILKSVIAGLISLVLIIFFYRFIGISSSIILFAMFLIFLFIYSVLLLVFKTLDKNDIFILTEIEKKSGFKITLIRKFLKNIIR